MNKAEWEDNVFQTPNLRITITNSHIHYKGIWVLSVRELNIDCKDMGLSSIVSMMIAREKALNIVTCRIKLMLSELSSVV